MATTPTAEQQKLIDAALAEQATKFEQEKAEAVEAARAEASSSNVAASSEPETSDYELLSDTYTHTTSKPGQPFTYREYVKGDKVPLTKERADELIAAGAVKDPSGAAKDDAGAKPGEQTKAPTAK